MEDPIIDSIHNTALEYRRVTDRRINILKKEVELKQSLLAAMKKAKKEKYFHNGVSVKIVVEKEKVVVRVNPEKRKED